MQSTEVENESGRSGINHEVREVDGIPIKLFCSNIRPKNIDWEHMLVSPLGVGKEGNLIVVESLSSAGFRTFVENQQGVDEQIQEGDRFVAVLANRNSGTSESGYVPQEGIEINQDTRLSLLSAGGVVGIQTGIPGRDKTTTMALKPLGLISDHKGPVDLVELSGGHDENLNSSSPIVLVCGTSAEVGKTTTSAALIRVMREQGLKVGGAKIAGTGRMRDILSLRDAGAFPWMDFPDVGLATTYTGPEKYRSGIYTLINRINSGSPDIIVAEAGGDPIEANIPTFLSNKSLMENVRSIVIVSGDVMGMMGTVSFLRTFNSDVQLFLTYPKDRNQTTTLQRVTEHLPGIPLFDPLNSDHTKTVVEKIMN